MPRRHETVDEALIVWTGLDVQRFDIAVPLRLGAWAGDGRAEEAVLEHPGQGEGHRGGATLGCVRGHLLSDAQGFRPPLGLLQPLVAASGARVRRWRRIDRVLAAQHAAGQGTIGDHAQAIVGRRRQLLDLGRAIDEIVKRFAGDRPIDAEVVGDARHPGDAPAAEIGEAEVAHLALADEVANGAYALFQGRIGDGAVEVEDVDEVRAQALQARFHRLRDPFAGLPLLIGTLATRKAELGRYDPGLPARRDGPADDLFRAHRVVDIGGIDEVDPLTSGLVDDALGAYLISLPTEHHGTEAQEGHLEGAAAESTPFSNRDLTATYPRPNCDLR